MSYIDPEENVPVRSFFDPTELAEDKRFTKDEEDERTLRQIYKVLKEGMDGLDQWHAFSDGHRQLSELKLKQDIHAHQIAAAIIAPALEAAEQALATVDEKFRQRNKK
jgi:hypothetical protein